MADEDTLEIVITLDDQASEGLRNLVTVLDQTKGGFGGMESSMTRTNISNMTLMKGLSSTTRGMSTLTSGLEHFLGADNQLVKSLKDVHAVMQIVLGPARMIVGIMSTLRVETIAAALANEKLMLSFSGVLTAAAAVVATYGAMTAASDEEKTRMSALAGVLWGLTAAQWAYVAAKSSAWTVDTMGAAAPILIAAIAGVVAAVGSYAAVRYMHTGGVVGSDEQMTVLQKGEGVVAKGDMNALRSGRGGSTSIYNFYGDIDSSARVRQIRRELDWRDRSEAMRKGIKVVSI